MDTENHHQQLVHILQMAYSGEKSAALAYQGHADCVTCPNEKAMIRQIEQEEWDHRHRVGEMLAELGGAPSQAREVLQTAIGQVLKLLCPVSGWFLPMYSAWKLEEKNIQEYAHAALHAHGIGRDDFANELMIMSAVERQHAEYFASVVKEPQQRLPKAVAPVLSMINLVFVGKLS